MTFSIRTSRRLRAAAIHLGISVGIAAGVAIAVLAIWYPGWYAIAAGGSNLFWLVVGVDVALGPMLTLLVFDTSKRHGELVRDLAVIAVLQMCALGYGLHVVFDARPVALVFEVDRFRLVAANEVRVEELRTAAAAYHSLPLVGGPWLLGTRGARPGTEQLDAIDLALHGYDISQRPSFWQSYTDSRAAALARSRPAAVLLEHYPSRRVELEGLLTALRLPVSEARFLPLVGHRDGVVFLSGSGEVAGFAAVDGFF